VIELAWRPSLNVLHGFAIAAIKECARRAYTCGLTLTFLAYRRKRLQRVVGEVASSLSQFPLLVRRSNDYRRRAWSPRTRAN
jgi:hypothetical protein